MDSCQNALPRLSRELWVGGATNGLRSVGGGDAMVSADHRRFGTLCLLGRGKVRRLWKVVMSEASTAGLLVVVDGEKGRWEERWNELGWVGLGTSRGVGVCL